MLISLLNVLHNILSKSRHSVLMYVFFHGNPKITILWRLFSAFTLSVGRQTSRITKNKGRITTSYTWKAISTCASQTGLVYHTSFFWLIDLGTPLVINVAKIKQLISFNICVHSVTYIRYNFMRRIRILVGRSIISACTLSMWSWQLYRTEDQCRLERILLILSMRNTYKTATSLLWRSSILIQPFYR